MTALGSNKKIIFGVALLCISFLFACNPAPTPTLDPTATPTDVPGRSGFEDNVEALNQAQAVLDEMEFGFAPLLLEDDTRLILEPLNGVEAARLAYPLQPTDPTAWKAGDSFVLSYAVRRLLLDSTRLEQAAIGVIEVTAPVADTSDVINHFAIW
ncbi:MAG: hypothetical protein AAF485_13670, partial [Chloroflexota bacterium]